MELISLMLSLFLANSTGSLETVTVDSPFITGNAILKEDIEFFDAESITLFDDCNKNPFQYNKFHNKIIPYNCKNCFKEYWNIWGISMTPTIKSGSILRFNMNGFKNLKEGMIVVYDTRKDINGSPLDMDNAKKYDYNIIHRIVAVNKDSYVIKGDNNLVCELLKKSDIKAVLEYIDYGA